MVVIMTTICRFNESFFVILPSTTPSKEQLPLDGLT